MKNEIEDYLNSPDVISEMKKSCQKTLNSVLNSDDRKSNVVSMNNLTPRAKKVLAVANMFSEKLNHSYVGAEHILLGCLYDEGNCKKYLEANFIDWYSLGGKIYKMLEDESKKFSE